MIEELYNKRKTQLQEKERTQNQDHWDLSLPGPVREMGAFHPIEQMIQKTLDVFSRLGYSTVSGPLIETDWYNFSALNIPRHHPARDDHDTFYLDSDHLLRTHTSPVQIRSLEKFQLPLAVVALGLCFEETPRCLSFSSFSSSRRFVY